MAYYNPLIQQIFNTTASPVPQPPKSQQHLAVNPQQFASVAATLDDNSLNQLISMAQQRGISDQDIQTGLAVINQYRKK